MPETDQVLSQWKGMIDNDFKRTFQETFALPPNDDYKYVVEGFSMTLAQVQEAVESGRYVYRYSLAHSSLPAPKSDIEAYTHLFASTASASKALTAFVSNAKKGSPREAVASYLSSRRVFPDSGFQVPKCKRGKEHVNPYYDIWTWTCHVTGFLGPLGDKAYASKENAKLAHPVLPVLYHHFGCVCPSWEGLNVISQLVKGNDKDGGGKCEGVVDMGSGNGYWSCMLRRMGVDVVAVDNMESKWRYMWVNDTVKMNGVEWLKRNNGAKERVLLMVYMVTKGTFTRDVLKNYKGDWIVVAGTQNENRYTGFADVTVEDYFERERKEFEICLKIALPSFAGKDEGLLVYQRKK